MGSLYCAINWPRGSRDRRSRDFCPRRGPSDELIAQYRPPMSFCFYPPFFIFLSNTLFVFFKPGSSWKQQKNSRISEIDSVPTQLNVSLWWRHNIYLWRHIGARRHAIFFKFLNISKISMSDLAIVTSLLEVLSLCFRKSHNLKIVRFFHSFADSCIGTFCHHKDFTGRVLPWENCISPRNNLFHTQRRFFSGKVQIPKWAPFAPNGTANQIAGKFWNHPGQHWTLNPMARKPWISHPSVG